MFEQCPAHSLYFNNIGESDDVTMKLIKRIDGAHVRVDLELEEIGFLFFFCPGLFILCLIGRPTFIYT